MKLEDKWKDDILTDNTSLNKYQQCKGCKNIGNDMFSDRYDKGSCLKFPYPKSKSFKIMLNEKECPYKD